MPESIQDQLARLAKSGELKTNSSSVGAPNNSQHKNSSDVHLMPDAVQSYENLILENERLRKENIKLTDQLNAKQPNPNDELNNLQQQLSDALARLKETEGSKKRLTDENLRLNQRLAEVPSAEEILRWQEKVSQADDLIQSARQSISQHEVEKQQLSSDRQAFENDLARIEELDAIAAKIIADQEGLANSEAEILKRLAVLESTEKRLSIKQTRLEKLSEELNELQAKVGHLKGIERSLKDLENEQIKISRLYEGSKTRIRNLTAERDQAVQMQYEVEANLKRVNRDLKETLGKLAALPDGEIVIRSFETVKWLVSQFDDPRERVVPKQVLLVGDGPWPIDDFTDLLQDLGFEVWQNGCDADIEVVIVGRDNWSETVIDGQIEDRDGESLRVYSQELFVLLLAMQADPLEVTAPDALLRFVDSHPVFNYLFNQEFPWPETVFEDGAPAAISEGFDGENASSPLYKMGYSVAQQVAISMLKRHEILAETYAEENLPWCISDEYMNDWGEANSRKRLRRIAWHIFTLMRGRFKRHGAAVRKWESDLAWLKRTYYKPVHRFSWPS
jgi:hypothetical protein